MKNSAIMPTYYYQLPVAFEYGKGVWLWDTTGKKYLDSLAGIAVTAIGHAHPALTATITEQANKLLHTSNTYRIPQQEELAELLTELASMEQAYFCNSGAEANEAALKLTRAYARKKNIDNPIVITMKNSFHGRSLATLTASGNERIRQGFEPLLSGFVHANFNDMEELKTLVAIHKSNIVAIMLEPIQGDGGIQIADVEYLELVRSLCDEHDWLMILDEIQTGIGRTGRWFCYQYSQIIPDVITVAKALANGIPIAACLARGKATNLFGPGKHGTTFGGNPFACACALTVLKTIKQENLTQNALEIGDFLQNSLKTALQNKCVIEIRGKGLMLGIELDRRCIEMVAIGLKHGVLFNVTADKVIRLLPPLILKQEEAVEIVKRVKNSIDEFEANIK